MHIHYMCVSVYVRTRTWTDLILILIVSLSSLYTIHIFIKDLVHVKSYNFTTYHELKFPTLSYPSFDVYSSLVISP